MDDIFYKPQNKNNTIGIILVGLITVIVMTLLGLVASTLAMASDTWAIDWILAGLFGVTAAFLINFLIKQFKVTTTNKLRILFLVVGIILAYTYVIGYVWAMLNHVGDTTVLDVVASNPGAYLSGYLEGVFNPLVSFPYAIEIANELLTYSGDSFGFGLAVYAYPIIITLMILFIPQQHLKPFDYETNKWMKKRRYQTVFIPLGRNTMRAPDLQQEIEAGDVSFFKDNVWEAKNRNWTELYLYLDQFDEPNGLIEVISVSPGSRGSLQRSKAFNPIWVDKNKLRALLNELEGHE